MTIDHMAKTKPVAGIAIAKIAEKALVRGLSQAGFKRLGQHLVRRASGIIHGIHFRAGMGMAAPIGTLTLSIVVTSDSLYQAWSGKPLPRNPATALFPLCQGIRQLAPDAPVYWGARPVDKFEELTDEIVALILARILPFLDKYSSTDALLERIRVSDVPNSYPASHWDIVRAILAIGAGLDNEAYQAINRAYDTATPIGSRAMIRSVAKRIGIPITAETATDLTSCG